MRFFNQTFYFVCLSPVPFRHYRHTEAFFKTECTKRRILELNCKFRRHGAQFHIREHIHRLLVYLWSPPFLK